MYEPTPRQSTALANLETFLGLRSHRTTFSDAAIFRTYWDLISKRCDATAHKRATTTPAERAEQRQHQQARSAACFQEATHLEAYGREYAARYQPSVAKLQQQLTRKCANNITLVETVMNSLKNALHDDIRALELAESLQRQGRHAGEMRSKLRQRLFSTATIDRCLETLSATSGSVLEADSLARKAHKLQRKGLSQRAMRRAMTGTAADGDLVKAVLIDTLGDQGDGPAIRSILAKLARKNLDRKKMIQRLMAKGFRYADIVAQLQVAAVPHA